MTRLWYKLSALRMRGNLRGIVVALSPFSTLMDGLFNILPLVYVNLLPGVFSCKIGMIQTRILVKIT